MQYPLAIAFLLILGVLAIVYPPAVACAYMLFGMQDTTGIGTVFTEATHVPLIALSALCFIATFKVFRTLWRNRNNSPTDYRVFVVSLLSVGITAWIGLSVYSDTGSVSAGLIAAASSGVYGVVFGVAYYRKRLAMIIMLLPVVLHLILTFGIVSVPEGPWALLAAPASQLMDSASTGLSDDGIVRPSGQFDNSVPLAFFGAIVAIVGLYCLVYSRRKYARLLGLALLVLGGWVSVVTIQRAVCVGLVIASFVLLRPLAKKASGKYIYHAYFLLVLVVLCSILTSTDNPTLSRLRDFFWEARSSNYRVMAAVNSLDVLFSKPLFGVSGEVRSLLDLAGGAPHQCFYFFAVMYGIPAGLGLLALTCLVMISNLRGGNAPGEHDFPTHQRYFALAVGWVLLSMSLTNNMSGGLFGWICLGFACLPWAYAVPQRQPAGLTIPRLSAISAWPEPRRGEN